MPNPKAGFTIIETTITLTVIAILSAIVLPKASGFIDSIEVRGAVTEAEALFSTARHVAIARGAQTTLEINAGRGEMSLRVGRDTLQLAGARAGSWCFSEDYSDLDRLFAHGPSDTALPTSHSSSPGTSPPTLSSSRASAAYGIRTAKLTRRRLLRR